MSSCSITDVILWVLMGLAATASVAVICLVIYTLVGAGSSDTTSRPSGDTDEAP